MFFLFSVKHKIRSLEKGPGCSFPYIQNEWEHDMLSFKNDKNKIKISETSFAL